MKNTHRCGLMLLTLLAQPLWADEPTPDAPESRQLGLELIMGMAHFLAGLDRFSVTVRAGYDVVQSDGQKIEFLEQRDIVLARPGQLRAQETRADGRNSLLLFDGARVTVWDAELGVFAQADQPGSIDDAVLYFVRDLGMRLPLAPLLTTRLPEEFERRLKFADYVETTNVYGEPVHHVAGRTAILDFQVWIDDGDAPWPRRLVMTYRAEPGQPQYWAEFHDWSRKPRIRKDQFVFDPPQNARQIVFAVQVPTLTGAGPVSPDAAATSGDVP